jgi:hypothetical protein
MRPISPIIAILCLIGAPLLGIHLSGEAVKQFLDFPPMTTFLTIDHEPFSWVAFFLLLFLIILTLTPFLIKIKSSKESIRENSAESHDFPIWGWAGLAIMLAGWVLAWTRFPWFSNLQTHTFTIPWIGYIILVNALTLKRSGRSLITHEPLYLACLFIFSALFWWYFEFLNQFVQNWYYVNVEALGRLEFFFYATLPFATVLPAVISTFRLLKTFRGLSSGLDHFVSIPVTRPRFLAVSGGLVAIAALSLTSIFPDYLFPMLWLAPTVIFAAALVVAGIPTFLHDIPMGNWRTLFLLAMSALVCGFFWEMWNYFSYTRWEYSVPFVHRFLIFEMPLLGYAGYLPFGIQCGLMAWLVKHLLNSSAGSYKIAD